MTNRFNIHHPGKLTAKLAVVAGLITIAPGVVRAECQELKGDYTFAFSGAATFPGSTTPTAFNGVGIQTFDGRGKWTGTESANFGAFVLRFAAFNGTYRLNPDCTGTITTIFPNGTSGQGADFVVAEGGKKIHAIGVTVAGPGNITTITFTKVPV